MECWRQKQGNSARKGGLIFHQRKVWKEKSRFGAGGYLLFLYPSTTKRHILEKVYSSFVLLHSWDSFKAKGEERMEEKQNKETKRKAEIKKMA